MNQTRVLKNSKIGLNKELNAGLVNHSWIINGMDCPSCARKIETAVKKVTGVAEARVAFATEKLLIKANNESVFREVEQVITEQGSPLTLRLINR